MAQTMYLQSVVCVDTQETGHDEVYIKYSIDGGSVKRYPSSGYKSMNDKDNNPWITNLQLTFNQTVRVELWDDDTTSDDLIGSHTYQSSDAPYTESNLITNSDGDRYVLVSGSKVK